MQPIFRTLITSLVLTLAAGTSAALAETNTPSADLSTDVNFISAKQAIAAKDWENAVYRLKYVKVDEAEVFNLTGYANRKLGRMDEAFRNYKIALDKDPNHRGAHEYVGEAYLLVNNLSMAEQHLAALDRICGKTCEEYKDLAREIAEFKKKK